MDFNGRFAAALCDGLTDSIAEVVARVQCSLVAVQDGRRGSGAGVVWRREGLVLTNNHVIARGGRVKVTLADGRDYQARLLATDPEIDLALLQVENGSLQPALIADSRSLRVGQYVLAVGHPWGQRGVVTAGVISSLGKVRTDGERGSVPVIHSDVHLAPGNSGGPLVNANGAVIGINTMVIGGDLGLAIPSHLASAFVDRALAQAGGERSEASEHFQAGSEYMI